ncbi:major facilitator superfamily domain-containing protein [Mycena amicta]|nr:major facilitator superfamily domain-containing protein [Mycena amicta]
MSSRTAFRRPATDNAVVLSWWRKPGALWLLLLAPFNSIYQAGTASAQVQLFSDLVCRSIYPDILTTSSTTLTPALVPCSADPAVQAAVAKLETVILTLTGVLTFVTAGWWGSFSDRHGRTRMLGIGAFGGLVSSFLLILVANFSDHLPGGYRFFVLSAVVIGLLGGTASESAAMNAYLADITVPEERSRAFSIVLGFFLIGLGLGPLLASLILRSFHNVHLVFYLAAGLKATQMLLALFILPESLTPEQMHRASDRTAISSGFVDTLVTPQTGLLQRILRLAMFVLKPLAIVLPEKDAVGKRRRGAWNILLLVLCEGLMLLSASSVINQFLYALRTFQWDAEYLGYCISSIGFVKATYLVLILPLVFKFVKHRPSRSEPEDEPIEQQQPLLLSSEEPASPSRALASASATAFDLSLARFSVFVTMVTFALIPLAPTGAFFILFISLGSFGAALEPAIHSIVLELYTRRVYLKGEGVAEAGKLFGVLAVVQAVFGNILGPTVYGSLYSATVANYPRTVFFVAFVNTLFVFGLLAFVRLSPLERSVEPEDEEPLTTSRILAARRRSR